MRAADQRRPGAPAVAGPPRAAAPAEAPNVAAYESYFASGHYDRRYPRPNPRVLDVVRAALPAGGHVIDFGCGSGRYLLALRDRAGTAAGFDVCRAALARLRAAPGAAGLHVLGPDPADLDRHLARHGAADVVLGLFGVLSHVEGVEARRRTLRRMGGLLKPGTGRLVLSVPNRRRRFRAEQAAQPARRAGEIRYRRRFPGLSLDFSYKLFDVEGLHAELAGAGLVALETRAESLVPESLVASSRVCRTLDRWAAPLVPARWGYGLLAVARPAVADDLP